MLKPSGIRLLLLALIVAGGTVHGQNTVRAGLQIRLHPTRLDYARPLFDGQGGYFRDEPVVFDLLLLSRFPDSVSGAEDDWSNRLAATLWAGRFHQRTQPRDVSVSCDRKAEILVDAKRASRGVEIAPGGSVRVRCRLDTLDLRLTPGLYTLSVGWNPQLKSASYRELKGQIEMPTFLDGFAEFEVREVTTNDERLDMLNHRAEIALEAGNVREALELLDDILSTQPRSVSALTTRARVRAARKDCKEALQDWQAAVLAVEQDLDSGHQTLQRATPEERRASARYLRSEQRSLRCN
jgi:hypothetical protein